MSHSPIAAITLGLALGLNALAPAFAADCGDRQQAGYRVLVMDNGRKVAVWYPAASAEQPMAYWRADDSLKGSVARDAPPAACPRVPLVLFSHGLGGCALQSVFVTEELARHGYVVAAPDHSDAVCSIGGTEYKFGNLRTEKSFLDPASWTSSSEIGRMHDLRAVMGLVAADPQLGSIADMSRVGAVGHSLGGYAVIGMAGGWPAWKTPQIKAVLALSPWLAPFLAQGTLGQLGVPVMYQGAQFDWGITPSLEGKQGAFAVTAPPKYFVKLQGGTHFEWTNLLCAGQASVVACLKARPNAYLIDRYGIEFLDRYLKDKPGPALASKGGGLIAYQVEVR